MGFTNTNLTDKIKKTLNGDYMNIGIISLGLIGGSILKSLSDLNHNIIAISQNPTTLAKAEKYTNKISSNLEDLKICDVVFVCCPIRNTIEILNKLDSIVENECIVMDVASIKEFVMNTKHNYKFIGSHPMAGTEFNGFEASFKDLFKGAKWVLTPSKEITSKELDLATEIIQSMGATTIVANATEHDEAVALISHMPMLVSQAIFKSAQSNELALRLASSGFRDMTRLAMSNPTMADDMINFNGTNIEKSLAIMEESINSLKTNNYKEMLLNLKASREKMYSKEGKNIIS